MQKFYEQNCLLEQTYFKDDTKKIKDLVNDAISTLGEKLAVRRLYLMKVGGKYVN